MFKDVLYEYHWSHDTHQADSPILAKRVPALHCQWLQQLLLFVPLAHPDLTPRDFFLWGFVKRLVYVPPILRDVDKLKARITKITQSLTMQCWDAFGKNWPVGLMCVM